MIPPDYGRLALIPKIVLVGAWVTGGIWAVSYWKPPPMPSSVGFLCGASAFAALAFTILTRPKDAPSKPYVAYFVLTVVANVLLPLIAIALKAPK